MELEGNSGRLVSTLVQPVLFPLPIVGLDPLPMALVNDLLERWGHRLGSCHRPFTQQGWGLSHQGKVVSVAVSASVVGAIVGGYKRGELVECARLCSAPGQSWATRVMLRLWREACACLWPDWEVLAAISYSQNAHHRGDIYRFDGWTRMSEDCGSSGGGTWSRQRSATDAVSGKKTLWLWRYARRDGNGIGRE